MLPHRCAHCGVIVASGPGFCRDCWTGLDFLAGPACARCALPLPSAAPGALCGACLADPPPYASVHVPLAYGPATRSVVLRLKYGRRVGLARLIARLVAATLPPPDAATPPPLLVPVPLHRWRLWSRGFNQSMAIATELAKGRAVEVAPEALVRTRSTVPLKGLGRAARARTVRGAFAVPASVRAAIKGREVWLIDDVLTTGATAAACARALLRGGAGSVRLIAFARVLDRGQDGDVDFTLPPADIGPTP